MKSCHGKDIWMTKHETGKLLEKSPHKKVIGVKGELKDLSRHDTI